MLVTLLSYTNFFITYKIECSIVLLPYNFIRELMFLFAFHQMLYC